MPNENTPLIQVVKISPPRQRYTHSTVRRFCTVALSTTLVVVVILFIIPLRWLPESTPHNPRHTPLPHDSWPKGNGLAYDDLQKILLDTPSEEKAREWSQYYTSGPHLAGKNFSQALWTKNKWEEFGIEAAINSYDVYINYPQGHRLTLLKNDKVDYECSLEEDVLEEDSTSGLADRIPTFHGYSASGNVTARYVYVNYGTIQDFDDLVSANVSLKGNIALIKYSHIFRGLKVKRAEELGMVGAVIYSDPMDDGEITEKNGYKPYPDGPARNPSSVQRGSVQFLSISPGDPTTPGYPSLPGAPRTDPHRTIPRIPSLPISYRDALPLLKALNGHGPPSSDFGKPWTGGLDGVEYNIGPSPSNITLNLVNEQEYVTNPIWNVIGVINGTIPDEVVVVGNHRDAWIAGGASDPNSGSAALNEVIRSFGLALEQGWKPLRTIVFASWDGEEYGLIGSTEWVEEFLPWLSTSAVAYINLDVGTMGTVFGASASPLLDKLIYEVTSLVKHPKTDSPIRDTWDGKIGSMGSGSDFTAFQDFAGVPSLDFGFGRSLKDPVYHYHSNYDSFSWMDKFGDKHWQYHVSITKVYALLAAKLSESPIIPLNTTDYAKKLAKYLDKVIDKAKDSNMYETEDSIAFRDVEESIKRLLNNSISFDEEIKELQEKIGVHVPWWKWWKKVKLYLKVRKVNEKLKLFERQFLYSPGLDSRPWFKHVVFAPGKWTGYSGATFPGLMESIEEKNSSSIVRWSAIIGSNIDAAARFLQ